MVVANPSITTAFTSAALAVSIGGGIHGALANKGRGSTAIWNGLSRGSNFCTAMAFTAPVTVPAIVYNTFTTGKSGISFKDGRYNFDVDGYSLMSADEEGYTARNFMILTGLVTTGGLVVVLLE